MMEMDLLMMKEIMDTEYELGWYVARCFSL